MSYRFSRMAKVMSLLRTTQYNVATCEQSRKWSEEEAAGDLFFFAWTQSGPVPKGQQCHAPPGPLSNNISLPGPAEGFQNSRTHCDFPALEGRGNFWPTPPRPFAEEEGRKLRHPRDPKINNSLSHEGISCVNICT